MSIYKTFCNQYWLFEFIVYDFKKEDLWKMTDTDDIRDLNNLHLCKQTLYNSNWKLWQKQKAMF